MTLNEMVGILAERAGKTFDVPFQQELKAIAKAWSATILRQRLEKNHYDRKYFYQHLSIPVEQVSVLNCPIKYGCTFRSVNKVPKPLRSNGILFDFVGSADYTNPFTYRMEWTRQFFAHSKYTGSDSSYLYADGYLYFDNISALTKVIGLIGIFPNTDEVKNFICSDAPCITDDDELPYGEDIAQQVIQSILSVELSIIPKKVIKENVEIDKQL